MTSWDAQYKNQDLVPGRVAGKTPLSIPGAWLHTPEPHPDRRGLFIELFRASGASMRVAQVSCSISERGVIRGIHVSDVPPGQAKYVMCTHGQILDVIVDLRTGSPTFGQWEGVTLDSSRLQAVELAAGLGHAFMALNHEATVLYLHSTEYDPATDRAVNPLDTELRIEWPLERGQTPVLSGRDLAAPSLRDALGAGWMPSYANCQTLEAGHAAI